MVVSLLNPFYATIKPSYLFLAVFYILERFLAEDFNDIVSKIHPEMLQSRDRHFNRNMEKAIKQVCCGLEIAKKNNFESLQLEFSEEVFQLFFQH